MPDCSIHAEPLRHLLARALSQHVSGLPDGRVDLREPGAVHALSMALAGALEPHVDLNWGKRAASDGA